MTQSRLKTICYIRHMLKNSKNKQETVQDLYERFPSFQDEVIDAFIYYSEQENGTYESQKKLYPYETEDQRRHKKSEAEKIKKIIGKSAQKGV